MKKMYDGALLLWALGMMPKVAWQSVRTKKYRGTWKERLFGPSDIDTQGKKEVIWFHAVSLGESNAAIPLVKYYRKKHPDAYILFSCTTKTAADNVKRKLPEVDRQIFFPLDFSWVMKRLMQQVKPQLVIVLESEFWLNFLSEAKNVGAHIVLANGKISERSFERFLQFPRLSKPLFRQFDLLCMQSENYSKLIKQLVEDKSRVHTTGNIKFDVQKKPLSPSEVSSIRDLLGIHEHERVIFIASSHEGEEKLLLEQIKTLLKKYPYIRILIAPRHPERFDLVEKEVIDCGLSCEKYEERKNSRVIVINRMGIMDIGYQISDIVIMAGSFTGKVGGHNILEPIEFKKVTLFGPYMYSQKQLWEDVLRFEAGTQVEPNQVAEKIDEYFSSPELDALSEKNAEKLLAFVKGATSRSVDLIDKVDKRA